jgi:hypothetical protein
MRKLVVILISFLSLTAFSQTNTYSPYSRFGLGDLSRQGLAFNKAMGGAGIALRQPNTLNLLNPASYTTQDTLSFIFDFGVFSSINNFKTTSRQSQATNLSLDHLVFGFPVTKWWKSSLGLVPYSRMGYNMVSKPPSQTKLLADYDYEGTGGLNKLFLGNAFKIKNLSVGANFNVVFGTLEQTHKLSFPYVSDYSSPEKYQRQAIRSTHFTFGFQYDVKLSNDFKMVVGGVLENKSQMVSKTYLLSTSGTPYTVVNPNTGQLVDQTSIDTLQFYDKKIRNHLPMMYGAGLSFSYKNKLTLTGDFSTQKWSEYQSFNAFDSLADSRYLNFGLQYTPDPTSIRSYWKRINFRAGFYTNDTYLKIKGQQLKDYGVSFGMRLPLKGSRSAVQISYEYGKRGTTDYSLIEENYHQINLSVSLYDFWFVKSKFD